MANINLKTAFLWRHRLLTLPAVIKPKSLEGIVEIDETLFAYSEKGNKALTKRKPRKRGMKAKKPGRSAEDWVPVLTARDRAHHTFEAILPATTTEQIKRELSGKIETPELPVFKKSDSPVKQHTTHQMFHGDNSKKQELLMPGVRKKKPHQNSSFSTILIHIGVDYLKSLSYVDGNRLAIHGWSYGGFMASNAITQGADYYNTAVAVAPVTNWRYYDNIYTERFMRKPSENEAGYDDNSPINHVDKLKGNYFFIHGGTDDNVHFQNSMDMITALVKANKQFKFMVYPNKNHGIYGGNTRYHLFKSIDDFLFEHLLDNE